MSIIDPSEGKELLKTIEYLKKHSELKKEIENLIHQSVENKKPLPSYCRERMTTSETLLGNPSTRRPAAIILNQIKEELCKSLSLPFVDIFVDDAVL